MLLYPCCNKKYPCTLLVSGGQNLLVAICLWPIAFSTDNRAVVSCCSCCELGLPSFVTAGPTSSSLLSSVLIDNNIRAHANHCFSANSLSHHNACAQVDLEIDSEADSAARAEAQTPGLSVRTGPSRRDIPPAAHGGADADAMEADAAGAAATETSSEETGEEGTARNGGKRKRLEGRRAAAAGRSRGPAAQPNGVPSAKGAHLAAFALSKASFDSPVLQGQTAAASNVHSRDRSAQNIPGHAPRPRLCPTLVVMHM